MKEMLKLNFEKILISKDNFSNFYKDKDLQGYKIFITKTTQLFNKTNFLICQKQNKMFTNKNESMVKNDFSSQ